MKGADVISYRFSTDSGRSKEYYSKSYDWAPESDLQVTPVRSRQQRGDVPRHALDKSLQFLLPCSMLFHGREGGCVTMWWSLAFGRGAKPGGAPAMSSSVLRINGQ
jgi:hypothetical protein